MTGSQPRTHGEEAWLGYTFAQLRQIADRAAFYCRWGDRFAAPERFEIAWAGPFELYKAAQRAIGRASNKELNELVDHLTTCDAPPEGHRAQPVAAVGQAVQHVHCADLPSTR